MLFTVTLYLSLVLCGLGLLYKFFWWVKTPVGNAAPGISPIARAGAAVRGVLGGLFSRHIGAILKALVLDGLFQRRSLAHSRLAWASHQLMFWGFVLLVLMHALEKHISAPLLPDYASTYNPYMFLRNLFGIMVLVGVGLIVYRRVSVPGMRLTTRLADQAAIGLIAVIFITGVGLEAVKITSQKRFSEMVQEYSTQQKPEDIQALEVYWGREFGVVFGVGEPVFDEALWKKGKDLHEADCAACHSRPQWAFLSYGLSRAIKPAAAALVGAGWEKGLWYVHFLACFLGLALLPWTKFLHLFTSPLLLAINAVADPRRMSPANLATLRALSMDACTHCAACSVHCSVAVALRQVPNLTLLPSEKLAAFKALACGCDQADSLARLREGACICTSCLRCTRTCPVGINLQDLWFALRDDLAAAGYGPTYVAVGGRTGQAAGPSRQQPLVKVEPTRVRPVLMASALGASFTNCFRCLTCSNVCPVVRFHHQDPRGNLDLMPHQIMHALGVGLMEEAMGARMVWSCLTCYHCQEACPQGVRVTDVLYELRNLAAAQGRPGRG